MSVLDNARDIASAWREEIDLHAVMSAGLSSALMATGPVDVVALGKAAPELAVAAVEVLDVEPWRTLVITDAVGSSAECLSNIKVEVAVGEHPVPGQGSLRAGRALIDFLEAPTIADTTLFLVSGGTSSICVAPLSPIELADVRAIWRAALVAGFDITELNTLRAATSELSGGRVLGHVRTGSSRALVMVDNVVSGAEWVASGLTYDHPIPGDAVESLLARLTSIDAGLAAKIRVAHVAREAARRHPTWPDHRNVVLIEPTAMLDAARTRAAALGYRVVDLGATSDPVDEVAADLAGVLRDASAPTCALAVGEVSVEVVGIGEGGRCQELAWHMASEIDGLEAAFVAMASDGRDHVAGVAGAWSDGATLERATALGLEWSEIVADNDSHRALSSLNQIFAGERTGWNLCDIYVACSS